MVFEQCIPLCWQPWYKLNSFHCFSFSILNPNHFNHHVFNTVTCHHVRGNGIDTPEELWVHLGLSTSNILTASKLKTEPLHATEAEMQWRSTRGNSEFICVSLQVVFWRIHETSSDLITTPSTTTPLHPTTEADIKAQISRVLERMDLHRPYCNREKLHHRIARLVTDDPTSTWTCRQNSNTFALVARGKQPFPLTHNQLARKSVTLWQHRSPRFVRHSKLSLRRRVWGREQRVETCLLTWLGVRMLLLKKRLSHRRALSSQNLLPFRDQGSMNSLKRLSTRQKIYTNL